MLQCILPCNAVRQVKNVYSIKGFTKILTIVSSCHFEICQRKRQTNTAPSKEQKHVSWQTDRKNDKLISLPINSESNPPEKASGWCCLRDIGVRAVVKGNRLQMALCPIEANHHAMLSSHVTAAGHALDVIILDLRGTGEKQKKGMTAEWHNMMTWQGEPLGLAVLTSHLNKGTCLNLTCLLW